MVSFVGLTLTTTTKNLHNFSRLVHAASDTHLSMLSDADIGTFIALGIGGGFLAFAIGFVYRSSIKVLTVSVGD
jgi:hypothetical protein